MSQKKKTIYKIETMNLNIRQKFNLIYSIPKAEYDLPNRLFMKTQNLKIISYLYIEPKILDCFLIINGII
jgi:hypothetical protein